MGQEGAKVRAGQEILPVPLPPPKPRSLAIVDADVKLGNEVTLVWGEEGGGSAKPVVERHKQVEIRAIVSPCPYSEVARTSYAEGWRTKAAVA